MALFSSAPTSHRGQILQVNGKDVPVPSLWSWSAVMAIFVCMLGISDTRADTLDTTRLKATIQPLCPSKKNQFRWLVTNLSLVDIWARSETSTGLNQKGPYKILAQKSILISTLRKPSQLREMFRVRIYPRSRASKAVFKTNAVSPALEHCPTITKGTP